MRTDFAKTLNSKSLFLLHFVTVIARFYLSAPLLLSVPFLSLSLCLSRLVNALLSLCSLLEQLDASCLHHRALLTKDNVESKLKSQLTISTVIVTGFIVPLLYILPEVVRTENAGVVYDATRWHT